MLDEMDKNLEIDDVSTGNTDDIVSARTRRQPGSLSVDVASTTSPGSLTSPISPVLDSENNTNLLSRFRLWIVGLVVLDFDLDFGQSFEFIYPSGLQFDEQEKSNMYIFLSFNYS
jgi:hypothetical protein